MRGDLITSKGHGSTTNPAYGNGPRIAKDEERIQRGDCSLRVGVRCE